MSLSWISWKPRIEEPSKPMPSSSASASTALGGTEKCCHTPGKSVNRKSIIWTFLSLIVLRTSWAVAQLRAMSFLPRLQAVALDVVAALINPHQAVQCARQFGRGRDGGGKLAVSTVTPRVTLL